LQYFKYLGLYYRTIKHLKPIQIRYRLWYILREKLRLRKRHNYTVSFSKEGQSLKLVEGLKSSKPNFQAPAKFTFLDQSHTFEVAINWNFSKYGELWTYNLNYFNYLHQQDMSKEKGLKLIREFIYGLEDNNEGLEPYPISLRCMNWITFLSRHNIKDEKVDSSLYSQYQILTHNIEYHVLGNHLLENGCSLLFGAFYFKNEHLWEQAAEIINQELHEQVLNDGGHYERSVMYHCIMLKRLLDVFNLLKHNRCFEEQDELQKKVEKKAQLMLGWVDKMQWLGGDLPEVNDFIPEMAPNLSALQDYSFRLGINPKETKLGESGYRRLKNRQLELLVDAGDIGPDYVPGHAHADTLSFLLRVDGQEVITEVGTSTYAKNSRRNSERSTSAHNTVVVEGQEQSEMWAGFRVGRRAYAKILDESNSMIRACHDGYEFMGITHCRSFAIENESIVIEDLLKSKRNEIKGVFYLHFLPGFEVKSIGKELKTGKIKISFGDNVSIGLSDYQKAIGYGRLATGKRAEVTFTDQLTTRIKVL